MSDVMANAKNKVQEAAKTCAQTAESAAEGIKSGANYVAEQARDAACNASKGLQNAGSYIDSKAEEATSALGSKLRAAGDAIRQNAPQQGRMGQASSAVADTLDQSGQYLEREGLEGIGRDVTSLIKQNPIPALLLGIGLGFLLARASSSRT